MSISKKSFLFFLFVDLVFFAVLFSVIRNFNAAQVAHFLPVLNGNQTDSDEAVINETVVLQHHFADPDGKATDIPPVLTKNLTMFNDIEGSRATGVIQNHTSTDLVPHRAYFDRRAWASHLNSTVVFVSVHKDYRDAILSCEIDGIQSKKTMVVDIAIAWFIEAFFPVTHRDCFVYCFNTNVNKNSSVSVLYEKNGTVIKVPVRSDSVVIPPKDVVEKDEVMVCAAGFGVVPYLDQWLTYQKTVGIKFIHINIDPSFLQNLNRSSVLINFVQTGFVKMVVWKDYLNSSQVYYYSQSLKYQDCALRYQGIYKYMLVIDFDEYFIPYGTDKSVLFYAKKLIIKKVGVVVLPRLEYRNISKDFDKSPLPSDGNMTKLYDTSVPVPLGDGKSLILVKVLEQNSIHQASLLPQYRPVKLRRSSARCYFAHLPSKKTRKK